MTPPAHTAVHGHRAAKRWIAHRDESGAAVATLVAVVVRSVGNHAAQTVRTVERPLDRAYMRVYATIVLTAGGPFLLVLAGMS